MKKRVLAAVAASMLPAGGVAISAATATAAYAHPPRQAPAHGRRAKAREWYADRHYVDAPRYHARRLGPRDRVYRGRDGRYYCKRDDGTTGLIIGGLAGGVLGNVIAPGGSKTLGTVLGAVAGGLVGKDLDDNNVVCK